MSFEIVCLNDRPEIKESLASWFCEKWGIPLSEYLKSMDESLKSQAAVPHWYAVIEGTRIIGGVGVIENDFHNRKDLTPNVCALYIEKEHRGNGIAGQLLNFVCDDMKSSGIDTLYLVTDHTSFYERYGWEFLCMVECDGETSRMYIHKM